MTIVETSDNGDLHVPAEFIGDVKPHTAFELQVAGDTLILRPVPERQPFWQRATPAERAEAFREWASTCPPVPRLPDEAFRRENWYE
jgi:hypothetical protein